MGIVNKRNAVVGWVVLKVGKRAAKKKAQGAVPDATHRRGRRRRARRARRHRRRAALLAQEARRRRVSRPRELTA